MSLRMVEVSRLAHLLEEHADFVWRSVRRLGVPESSADDAVQQVFLTLQSKLSSVAEGKERAFLFAVAMNVAAHARRTLARRREVDEDEAEDVVDGAPLPDEALDQRRARALLDEILDAMDLELRGVFVMHELEEMTMAEIAEVLALPPGTIASRLRRAREDFQKHAARIRARVERRTVRPPAFTSSTKLAIAGGGIAR